MQHRADGCNINAMDINDYLALTGISPAEAAAQLGCERSTVGRWCSGETVPNRYYWQRIQAWSRGAVTKDVAPAGKRTTSEPGPA